MARDEDGAILHEAIHARDPHAAAVRYTEDAVLVAPEGRFEGREAIARFFAGWFEPYADPEVDEWYRFERDGRGVVASTFSATHTGPVELPGGGVVEPTGTRIAVRAMETFVVDADDQLVEHFLYYDRVDLMAQLGLEPRWVRSGDR